MSGIFGILNLDGRPADGRDLDRVRQAMAHWGPDGSRIWQEGQAGLGHLLLYSTPQSINESLPLHHPTGDLVLTASARLDNRDDLLSSLAISSSERDEISDCSLILRAYEKWGADCPQHLLGDWAFALWDKRTRKLFLARDHFGHTGLYYYRQGNLFVFASAMQGVLAVPEVLCRLNPMAIAQMSPGYPADETTPYQQIFRLTPAKCMTVSEKGIQQRQYWHPREIPDVRFRRDEEYVEAFLDIYGTAVRSRLRSHRPVGITLSGGLDSSSTAAVAAPELARRGQRLKALTSIPKHESTGGLLDCQFGDERPFVEKICRHVGNIDTSFVSAEDIGPVEGIRQALDIYHEPLVTAANNYWLIAVMQRAKQMNVGTLLTGQGGNLTISWPGNRDLYLWTLLSRGRIGAYFHEVNAWRKENRAPWWRTLKNQLGRSVIPNQLLRMRNRSRARGRYMSLKPEFFEALARDGYHVAPRPELKTVHGNSVHRKFYSLMRDGQLSAWSELGAAFGINVTTPTFDQRLISFCLGIPQDQYTRGGQEKLLIRRAMKGRLPKEILWSEQKGKQSADIIRRLRDERDEVQSVLHELRSSNLAQECLNLPLMTRVFESLQHDVTADLTRQAIDILMKGVMIGLFLRRFETPRDANFSQRPIAKAVA